jgi:hypothetical protein
MSTRAQAREQAREDRLALRSGLDARHAALPEPKEPFDNESLTVLSICSGKTRAAMRWFEKAHRGVSRKSDADVPYANHVFGVALIVAATGGSRDDVIAALGHDSIEDTSLTYEEIAREFGGEVADTILALTKDEAVKALPLEEQAPAIMERLMAVGPSALRCKGADVLYNASEVVWDCEERGVEAVRAMFGPDRAQRKARHYVDLALLIAEQVEDRSVFGDLAASLRQRAGELDALCPLL